MRDDKRALSTIVITLIIIFLSIVAVGIVWIVVRNLISENSSGIGIGAFTSNLDISRAYIENETIVVDVKRNSGEGELVKIKFVFSDGKNSEVIEKETNLKELETKRFFFNLTKLIPTEIKTLSISPIFQNSEGDEVAGNIADSYNLGGKECVSETNEETCGELICGTKINNCNVNTYCGHCPENQTCSDGLCLSDCTNTCPTNGTRQCSGNGYQTCGNYDSDICLEWSNATTCLAGQNCSSGICSSGCTSVCQIGSKQCLGNGSQTCGNYDSDSCLEWGSVTSCPTAWNCSAGFCEYNLQPKIITIGQHYDYGDGQDEATVEFIDLQAYRNKELILKVDARGYTMRINVFNGRIDLNKWWGDSKPWYFETVNGIHSLGFAVPPNAGEFSIVYITNPVRYGVPEKLQITRNISIKDPKIPSDFSDSFVTDYASFPDNIKNALTNPYQFNEIMNAEYDVLKDLTGYDSDALNDGYIRLVITDHDYCGLAGNPIRMDPSCMDPDMLNSGDPGWGAAHELGHLFACKHSYCWSDTSEMWANFMAFYSYDNDVFTVAEYSLDFWYSFCPGSANPSNELHDIFWCKILELKDEHSWEVAKKFFRKYSQSDPAAGQSDTEKQKLAVTYLARSVRDITGQQNDYDEVVNYLVSKGFPSP
ncbi:MAG: hypothetical protein M1416_01175 [Candidatus Pacearchaeota archaeon]|nr:hypothetical protein [Candidatus Pacearchaeota archaeon]